MMKPDSFESNMDSRESYIFRVPYSKYDQFIDKLLEVVKLLGISNPGMINIDDIEFFARADEFDAICTRHQLAEWVFAERLRKLRDEMRRQFQGCIQVEELVDLIDICLLYL